MTGEVQASAVPGWYEDPEAADLLRWWDGASWSDTEFRPKPVERWGERFVADRVQAATFSAPAGKGSGNAFADRARRAFFWALGVGIVFWVAPVALTAMPNPQLQSIGILMVWIGMVPALVLSILAIVFGGIGLSRARVLGGRRPALTGLVGGICVLVGPPVLSMLVIVTVVSANALRTL
ncbi:hypothetical protein ASE14_19125 [Agromyces sp. Root81]|uniref:DUF2510 domain-containing protein n=1 Tax=Agromyces sp. Root81 TaxID=1736601 RepID=UPI0006F84405|nr:DUF2510 domain-containing protein [Agromyces sp. Root81]KRC58657.1 hypothetical protein ASE14_19125 [Agromyces sp. Root81]